MIGALARKIFGSSNERRVKAYMPRVAQINALEKELEKLSDEALQARTVQFRKELEEGKTLDDILVPAFATCRRRLDSRHARLHDSGGTSGGRTRWMNALPRR